jgi:hypothetical protein
VSLSIGSRAIVAVLSDLASNAQLVDGSWPSGGGEVSIQADAANQLGIVPGSEFLLGDAAVTLSGTWRLSDSSDPRWLDDPLLVTGERGGDPGPIVVDESLLTDIGIGSQLQSQVSWTVLPAVSGLSADDLTTITDGWQGMSDSLDNAGLDPGNATLTGRFASNAATVLATVEGIRGVAPLTVLVMAAVALVTLVELARLLCALRRSEMGLQWSRGSTTSSLAFAAGAEAALVALLGAGAGTVASMLLFNWDISTIGSAIVVVPAAVAVTAGATFAATTFIAVRAIARGDRSAESSRLALASGVATPILVGLSAIVATAQLLRYGSPLISNREGRVEVDPIAVAAPAILLVAIIFLARFVVPISARIADRNSARSKSLQNSLVSRTLARRSNSAVAALVLCALAAGQLTMASGYARTWGDSYSTTQLLRTGAEVVLSGPPGALDEAIIGQVASTAGISNVATVYSERSVVGSTSVSVIAATPQAVARLASSAGGIFDQAAASHLIDTAITTPVIPTGTRQIGISTSPSTSSGLSMSIALVDELGNQLTVDATPTNTGFSVQLPSARVAWRILAFNIQVDPQSTATLVVTTLDADGSSIDLGNFWTATGFDPSPVEVELDTAGVGFRGATGLSSVHISVMLGSDRDTISPPVVVSSALAQATGIVVGDTVPVTLEPRWPPVPCVVSAIVPAIPGAVSDASLLIDASVLRLLRLKTYAEPDNSGILWIDSGDPPSTVFALLDRVPSSVLVQSGVVNTGRSTFESASIALNIGAVGTSILAIIALLAVAMSLHQSSRNESLLLHATGVSKRELSALRRAELLILSAGGIAIGVVAGLIVTVLTIPAIARTAIPDSYSSITTPAALDFGALAVGILTLTALVFGVISVYGASIHSLRRPHQ